MNEDLFSIRMRSERDGRHVSGAETLAGEEGLQTIAGDMVRRALEHSRGAADRIFIQLEKLAEQPLRARVPAWTTHEFSSWREGRAFALSVLVGAGVAPAVAEKTSMQLADGAAGGAKAMRGALLVDASSGARLEPDQDRGIRVSRMGISESLAAEFSWRLARDGIDRPQVREALVLAGKVLAAPGIIAELCWSDNPDYTTGYVSSSQGGYQRIEPLKEAGDHLGGRAFFLQPGWRRLAETISFLERKPVLFDRLASGGRG